MNTYLEQLRKDFGDWGNILSVGTLFTQDPSPFKRLLDIGFSKENSRIIFSVCPDDVNRLHERDTIENKLRERFGEEFHLGNLAAYPIGGITGISAASHHCPDYVEGECRRSGNLIFFISPHLGLDLENEVLYGYIQRPGQVKLTTSCGAMMGFLRSIRSAVTVNDLYNFKKDPNDPTNTILFKDLIDNYKEEIIENLHSQDINLTIIKLAKINYDLVMTKFKTMMQAFLEMGNFKGEFAIIGGITVNTQHEDFFIFRDHFLNST
ncbi:MAG TPA: hypothetical protein VMV43_00945 [Candidatus Nanopelagicaceae bacterium]|nr:hypothetical protein [Candidatus Nanopelagicaceae bacterium]